ncbi:MAG: bifunctional 5,10-methylenetetrahydrofolate dehydrogenase/5,10-methenyltetrahydrofolate cyclohydrolase [Oscillospiraceae bacterium]|nr:bifunctional 5,10-methylenetetrahydrofolate dehydrogenase/5,10-methenyltetrahydrofolate cyclohydrolase [Oscillospiraceae bacterium]
MAELLKGAPVATAINERVAADIEMLKGKGVEPCLAIVQLGNNDADTAYANGAKKKCAAIGVAVKEVSLSAEISEAELIEKINELNNDTAVHGVLLLRPLPAHISDDNVRAALRPEKDIDGITDISLAGVFTGNNVGFAPCTAQACIEILDHYGITLKGKTVCVIGRSLVVGRPVAMMALRKNATVTICHSNTVDIEAQARQAEIVIAAIGKAGAVDGRYMSEGQIFIDVGINVNDAGKLCGDVDAAAADAAAAAYTPVPGGVGSVTTSVLISHVVEAAKRAAK